MWTQPTHLIFNNDLLTDMCVYLNSESNYIVYDFFADNIETYCNEINYC